MFQEADRRWERGLELRSLGAGRQGPEKLGRGWGTGELGWSVGLPWFQRPPDPSEALPSPNPFSGAREMTLSP